MRLHRLLVVLTICSATAFGESAWTLLDKGIKEYEKGRLERAQNYFTAALRADGRCEDAYYYLGRLAEKRGDTRAAVSNYNRISEKWPSHSLAAQRLGLIARASGEHEAALKYFQTHATQRPSADGWMQVAAVQMDLKKFEDAEKSLAKAAKWTKGNLNLAELRGRLFMETKRYKEALGEYTRIVEKIPVDSAARFLRAVCLEKLERTDEAHAELETVLKHDPFHAGALRRLVKAYAADPAKKDAVAQYKKRLERLKKNPPKVRSVKGG